METLTLSQALEQGYKFLGPGDKSGFRPGYMIKLSKPKPFVPHEQPVGWDSHGPIFPGLYDYVFVTLQNLEEVGLLNEN